MLCMNDFEFYLVKDKTTQEVFTIRDLGRQGRFMIIDNFTPTLNKDHNSLRYNTNTIIVNPDLSNSLQILGEFGAKYETKMVLDKYPEWFL